jgi:hypothetical protein
MVFVQVLLCLTAVRIHSALTEIEDLRLSLSASHPGLNSNQSGAYV